VGLQNEIINGDITCGVPHGAVIIRLFPSAKSLEIPKSVILGVMLSSSSMLSGLISLWIIFCWWRWCNPRQIPWIILKHMCHVRPQGSSITNKNYRTLRKLSWCQSKSNIQTFFKKEHKMQSKFRKEAFFLA
jgi:hypothetical protein